MLYLELWTIYFIHTTFITQCHDVTLSLGSDESLYSTQSKMEISLTEVDDKKVRDRRFLSFSPKLLRNYSEICAPRDPPNWMYSSREVA